MLFGEDSSSGSLLVSNDTIWNHIDMEIWRLHQIRKKAEDYIIKAQALQRNNAEKTHKPLEIIKIGDEVLVYWNMVEASWS